MYYFLLYYFLLEGPYRMSRALAVAFVVALVCALLSPSASAAMKTKVILDHDGGVDDYLGTLYL